MSSRRIGAGGAWLLLLLVALATGGCMRAARQAYYELRGAQAKVHPVTAARPGAFTACQSVEFAAPTTNSGDLCPPALLEGYRRAATEARRELERAYPGGSPALRVESEFVFFQAKGLFDNALSVVRTRMFKGAAPVFHAIVISQSRALTQGDEEDLAEACVGALVEFLVEQKRGGDERATADDQGAEGP